jgi:hypothetical protein
MLLLTLYVLTVTMVTSGVQGQGQSSLNQSSQLQQDPKKVPNVSRHEPMDSACIHGERSVLILPVVDVVVDSVCFDCNHGYWQQFLTIALLKFQVYFVVQN